jgi:hypothetical protein
MFNQRKDETIPKKEQLCCKACGVSFEMVGLFG